MDDPWGSPWAEEPHQPLPSPNSKATNGLTLAPNAQGKNAAATEKTNSPWDLPGDGFGSWAESPEEQEVQENSEVSRISLEWRSQGAGHEKKLDISGLTPHWGGLQAGSGLSIPKLYPVPLPTPTELPRQPSPDPWATATVSPDLDLKDTPEVGGEVTTPNFENPAISNSPRDRHTEQHGESLLKTVGKPLEESESGTSAFEAAPERDPKEAEKATSVPDKESAENNVDKLSRPSSQSDHSHHDETHSESPRTSLDEDSHRPEAQRSVSEKIQVLVEHYDALAKAQLEEPVIIGRGPNSNRRDDDEEGQHDEQTVPREVSPEELQRDKVQSDKEETKKEEAEGADDDFGDFEEGHSQISDSILEQEQTSVDTRKEIPDDKTSQPQEEKPPPSSNLAPIRAPPKDFGRVKYIVDIPSLDTFYPGLKPEPTSDRVDKLYIPDTIPHDSFASVEERKIWYRLSRYTTLRQHNSGDDENNYIRVSWTGSHIREETLKVAGKWMEQDRISGRVVLGGDSKDGSLFGWNDPKAAPMPLATAFAISRGKKKSNAPTIATASSISPEAVKELPKGDVDSQSSSQPSQKHRRRSSTKASRTSEETKQRIQQPVASFGWSSEPQTATPVPALNSEPIPSNQISAFQKPETSSHLQLPSGTVAPATSVQQIPSSLDGWNTSPPIIEASTHFQTASDTIAPALPAQQMPSSFDGWNTSPLSVKTSAPVEPPTTVIQPSSNAFDDWGDMISSPVVTSPPQMPPLRGLSHKKSQSLIGASFQPAHAFSNCSEVPSIPLGNSHRPTSSLDGISIPNMQISATAPATANQFSANAVVSNAFATSTNNASSAANNSYDPWAAADFSVFETPAPPPKPKSAPPPKPTFNHAHRQGLKSVSFESTRAMPAQRGDRKTTEQVQQHRTVTRIIMGLPDLSYMDRR